MQENWIGRSQGTQIGFTTESGTPLPVFTTRPDTVFGATFMVIAPEHPLVDELTVPERQVEVQRYVERAKATSEIDRLSTDREKTGVFTGSYAINPLNGEQVQLWIADYVLASYGTGVVMGVPAHDTRDFAFAKKYGVPMKLVIQPPDWEGTAQTVEDLQDAYVGPGKMVNSGEFDGIETPDPAIAAVTRGMEASGHGNATTNYRMRDWLISRQRYWGSPIPIVYCPLHGEVPLRDDQLPVELPEMADFAPDGSGRSPLARAAEWIKTTCPECGGPAERETDTMGGFACSSWYFLRFCSPDHGVAPFDRAKVDYWMPVDQYVGGAEHAVLQLLYARFWTRVMHDAGLIGFREPFYRLRNQGMLVVSTPHRRATDPNATEEWIPVTGEEAEALRAAGQSVEMRSAKMSKSLRNIITPDEMVTKYGADSLRMYEMFMAPFDQEVEWNEDGINGQRRFMGRVWNLVMDTWKHIHGGGFADTDVQLERLRHKTVKKVTEDMEQFRFNTMVSALMTFANALGERHRGGSWKTATFAQCLETLVLLLAPSAPFIAEGIWQQTGGFGRGVASSHFAGAAQTKFGPAGSVHQQTWPAYDDALTLDNVVTVVVQVNGKVRDRLELSADVDQAHVQQEALSRPRIQELVTNPITARYIYIKGRLLNIVVQ